MRYVEFRDQIKAKLRATPAGLTWVELREALGLPDRACPAWTRRLKEEIGLTRSPGAGRTLVWRVSGA